MSLGKTPLPARRAERFHPSRRMAQCRSSAKRFTGCSIRLPPKNGWKQVLQATPSRCTRTTTRHGAHFLPAASACAAWTPCAAWMNFRRRQVLQTFVRMRGRRTAVLCVRKALLLRDRRMGNRSRIPRRIPACISRRGNGRLCRSRQGRASSRRAAGRTSFAASGRKPLLYEFPRGNGRVVA